MQNKTIESGVQLFSRMKSENSPNLDGINPKLFPDGGPFPNQVIEVVFDENIDYTDFFTDFMVRVILPSRLSEQFKESQVIWLHTDFQINLFKIIKFIEKKLEQCNITAASEKKDLLEEALRKLVILNCYTADQLEITFHNLERIINNCQSPSLVILDNCLSQYWVKKASTFMLSFEEHCTKMIDQIYEKIKDLNVVLMYGRTTFGGEALRRATQVGYTISVVKGEENYVANVTNLENNHTFSVPFNVNICLEFT